MNAEQFSRFLENQNSALQAMVEAIRQVQVPPAAAAGNSAAPPVPLPPPLELEGDMEQNFQFFEHNWKNYASAVGMDAWPPEKNKQKTSVLLSVVGKSALKKYFNFELTEEQQQNPDGALAAIKQKVIRERNKMVDWYDYFSLTQAMAESVDEFVARLKSLGKLCRFGGLENDLVMYKVVTSNKWSKLRGKLLTTPNLTAEKAIDMCRAEEISEKHAMATAGQTSAEVNTLKKMKKKNLKCKYCGDWHEFTKGTCPALGKKCHGCGGKNHFEKVCKSDVKNKSKKKKNARRVKKVQDDTDTESSDSEQSEESESDSSNEEAVIGKVYDFSDAGGNVLADLDMYIGEKWQSARCELDTGANTSLVGRDWLIKATGCDNPQMLPSKYRLQSFGGGTIPVLGEVRIPCRRNDHEYTLALQVVNVNHRPLLSAKVCKKLGFVKFCHSVHFSTNQSEEKLRNVYRIKAQETVQKHRQLFEGYGKFPGVVSLEVNPEVPPSIQHPRRVPIAMRRCVRY